MIPLHRNQFESWLGNPDRRPLIMGVLNVTPDSFSDGGRFDSADSAIAQARQLRAEGADWIDVGGESTRPGAAPVPPSEQIARVVPVIKAIGDLGAVISIDTTDAAVAAAALDAGATVVNDISAARFDPGMLPLIARRQAAIVLMHIQGTPATMQRNPTYRDVSAEVIEHLRQRAAATIAAGVAPHRILVDPGIGFGKTTEHNLLILRNLRCLVQMGHPVVVGTSRKGFIGQITGETPADSRQFGTAATVAWAIAQGAVVLRIHDAKPMIAVARMTMAIIDGKHDSQRQSS